VIAWVEQEYPTLPRIQITNCRKIAGSSSWSQHSWSNAADIFVNLNTGNQLAGQLRERFGPWIKALLWQVPDHYDHIHVDMWPTGIGTPPCAGGTLQVRYRDGSTGGKFTNDITPIGDDEMSLVARLMVVEAGAKTWLPTQADIDYWMLRADNLTNPVYAAEWRKDFEQMWAREKQKEYLAAREPGPKGDPGATVDQVTAEIVKRLGNG
jgi:hypothetical protein